jgi:hypothetical protein
MLVKDMDMAKHLNLTKISNCDPPQDFYTLVSSYLHEYFISILKDESNLSKDELKSYKRLVSLEIKRSVIKKSIMTIPYNASSPQLIKYLQEDFEFDVEKNEAIFKNKSLCISDDLIHDVNVDQYYKTSDNNSKKLKKKLLI